MTKKSNNYTYRAETLGYVNGYELKLRTFKPVEDVKKEEDTKRKQWAEDYFNNFIAD